MTWSRKGRYFILLVSALARKYTRFIAFGFFVGLVATLLFLQLRPFLVTTWFTPVHHIGIVGEFTPSTLPLIIQQHVSQGLTKLAPDGSALPALAERWEATDSGKTYVFYLRSDAKWQTGRPIVATDINYNIRSVQFSALNPHALKVSLGAAYSPFPTLLAKPVFLSGLRGTGPYGVQKIQLNGDKVIRLRLAPLGDRILPILEYAFYKTEAAAHTAFQLGDIDELDDVTSLNSLKGWGEVTITPHVKYNQIVALFFNVKEQELKERNFRQGLAYAIPDFSYERAVSPISKTSWAYTDKIRQYKFDALQAKRLLGTTKIASESGGLTLTTLPPYVETAQAIADSWTALGIHTQVRVENSVPSSFQVLLAAQELPPDPDQYPFWHSTQTQTNVTGYDTNVKIDKLLEDGRQELDQEQRKKIYADFQRRLVEDVPAVFLYYPQTYTVRRGK